MFSRFFSRRFGIVAAALLLLSGAWFYYSDRLTAMASLERTLNAQGREKIMLEDSIRRLNALGYSRMELEYKMSMGAGGVTPAAAVSRESGGTVLTARVLETAKRYGVRLVSLARRDNRQIVTFSGRYSAVQRFAERAKGDFFGMTGFDIQKADGGLVLLSLELAAGE